MCTHCVVARHKANDNFARNPTTTHSGTSANMPIINRIDWRTVEECTFTQFSSIFSPSLSLSASASLAILSLAIQSRHLKPILNTTHTNGVGVQLFETRFLSPVLKYPLLHNLTQFQWIKLYVFVLHTHTNAYDWKCKSLTFFLFSLISLHSNRLLLTPNISLN